MSDYKNSEPVNSLDDSMYCETEGCDNTTKVISERKYKSKNLCPKCETRLDEAIQNHEDFGNSLMK